jgi:hypothetical protein
LIVYAKAVFALMVDIGGQGRLAEHKESAATQLKALGLDEAAEEVAPTLPECPSALAHVWQWFLKLHRRRAAGGSGPQALSFLDLALFVLFYGLRLHRFEVEALQALDDAYLESVSEQIKKAR